MPSNPCVRAPWARLAVSRQVQRSTKPVRGRVTHVRLSATPAGQHALAVFVLEWLGANEPRVGDKSAPYLAGLPADIEAGVRASAEATIAEILGGETPTIAQLLTTRAYLEDPPIAALSGPAGAVDRKGLLMHPQVLAGHTKDDGVSPFQMGVFLRESLLCERVGAPPPGAVASAPTPPEGLSIRESLEYRSLDAGEICHGCHVQFSPLGWPFLPFDPVGRWIDEDPSGKPWDLTGSVERFYGGTLTFASPTELVDALGDDPQVHGCFAQTALAWSFGRGLVEEDRRLVVELNHVAKTTHGDVRAILEAIVAAPEFETTPEVQ